MLNQKHKHKEYRAHKIKSEKKIEEIRVEIEKVLERLGQIEVDEPWMKTWHTRRE